MNFLLNDVEAAIFSEFIDITRSKYSKTAASIVTHDSNETFASMSVIYRNMKVIITKFNINDNILIISGHLSIKPDRAHSSRSAATSRPVFMLLPKKLACSLDIRSPNLRADMCDYIGSWFKKVRMRRS